MSPFARSSPLFALLLVAGLPLAAQADVVTGRAVFTRNNQSLYGSGNATNFNASYFAGISWDRTYTDVRTLPRGVGAVAAGYGALSLHPGRVGLEASVSATTGSADIQSSYDVTLSAPSRAAPGDTINISTAGMRVRLPGTNVLDVHQPNARLSLDAVVNLRATMGAGFHGAFLTPVHADGATTPITSATARAVGLAHANDLTLFSTGGEQRYNLATVTPADARYSLYSGRYGSVDIAAPTGMDRRSTIVQLDNTQRTHAVSENPILTADGSVFQALGTFVKPLRALQGSVSLFGSRATPPSTPPAPPPSGPVGRNGNGNRPMSPAAPAANPAETRNPDGTFGPGRVQIGYNLLDGGLSGDLNLMHDTTFTPTARLPVRVVSSDGQTRTGFLGDTFSFTAPQVAAGDTAITYSAFVDFGGTLQTNFGIQTSIGAYINALSATLDVFGYGLGSLGPLYTDRATAPVGTISIYDTGAFAVSGFNTYQTDIVVRVPTPPAGLALLTGLALFARRRRS